MNESQAAVTEATPGRNKRRRITRKDARAVCSILAKLVREKNYTDRWAAEQLAELGYKVPKHTVGYFRLQMGHTRRKKGFGRGSYSVPVKVKAVRGPRGVYDKSHKNIGYREWKRAVVAFGDALWKLTS